MRTTGRIDNRNDYLSKRWDLLLADQRSLRVCVNLSISLNREKRRRELLRVTRENSTMVKRIMDRKPETCRDNWMSSWSKNLLYLDNISKYNLDPYRGQVEIVRDLHLSGLIALPFLVKQPTEHESTAIDTTLPERTTSLPAKHTGSLVSSCHRNTELNQCSSWSTEMNDWYAFSSLTWHTPVTLWKNSHISFLSDA